MLFRETLKEVLWLLLTERRISYRRLRLEFDLDDQHLEGLRHELIEVKQVAHDQGGEFLVWQVESDSQFPVSRAVSAYAPLTITDEFASRTQLPEPVNAFKEVEPLPQIPANDAERRPLTVVFCDLADSTAMSTRLDLEDLQDVIRGYQDLCTGIIREYDGYIAKYMGDGILVYFGYPKSLERNAERAVRSGLAIIDALAGLNHTVGKAHDVDIAVRIGISTGMVIVGEIVGEGLAQERTVIGEAPNIAARLQGLASRNGIVIGALTKELTGDVFEYEDLGPQELKGITGSVSAWNVSGIKTETETGTDDQPGTDRSERPILVGRDEETGLLNRAWQSTKDEGRGHVVAISGEAGIGKSVLVDGLKLDVREEGLPRVTFRCSPYHTGSALYSCIEHFRHLAGWQPEDPIEQRVSKLESMLQRYSLPLAETVPILANLLSLPLPEHQYAKLQLSPQQLKQQIQDTILALTFEEAEKQPFLHVWEDLHWADPSTLELIGLLIEQNPTSSLLMVLTARSEFIPPWPARSHITPITLNRLERQHTETLIYRLAGEKPMPADVSDHIVIKTDGVPLYVEELTKTIIASDILKETDGQYELTGPLSSLAIPETLQESLMARLDRLPQVREIAQIGSVLGREFAYEMISGLSSITEEALQDGLTQLVDAELLYQRGRPPRAKYIFKHALVQDAAYESIMKRSRTRYHGQIAILLRTQSSDTVQAHPALIAHHYTEAGQYSEALPFWKQAASAALASSAMVEAVVHLEAALDAIAHTPECAERDESELEVQMLLGPATLATRGFAHPPLENIYNRALDLCISLKKPVDTIKVTRGLQAFHLGGGRISQAYELASQISKRADDLDDPALRVASAQVVGQMKFIRGEFNEALCELERGIAGFDPTAHKFTSWAGGEPGEQCHLYAAFIKWMRGHPTDAIEHCDQAIELSKAVGNKFSFANTLAFVTVVHAMDRDKAMALQFANQAVEICKEQSNAFWLNFSRALQSWADTSNRDPSECADEMGRAITDFRSTGARALAAFLLTRQAECLLESGRLPDAFAVINDAQAVVDETGERCWKSDLLRVKGEILAVMEDNQSAEVIASFSSAIEIAKQQGAASWALRAAICLAKYSKGSDAETNANSELSGLCDLYSGCVGLTDLNEARQMGLLAT
jgi:class 3 adenylate cyclase/tetratricopeptide (TPR) repeat protein